MTTTHKSALAAAGVIALLAVTSSGDAAAAATAEIEINDRAADVISEIATVVGEFHLSNLPAQLRIRANSMRFDYADGVLSYSGNVRVRHADVHLSADSLTFGFTPGQAQTLERVEANGNVTLLRGEQTAYGDTASYDPDKGVITLTGKARLGSGSNSLSGDAVVVYLDERRATVEGGQGPVRAIINPTELKEFEEKGVFD